MNQIEVQIIIEMQFIESQSKTSINLLPFLHQSEIGQHFRTIYLFQQFTKLKINPFRFKKRNFTFEFKSTEKQSLSSGK